jgi:leader peptidase (prepilin peptidase) / N-methyltransferase
VITQAVFLFKQELWFFYTIVFLLGLMVGSFLNVVIYRLPKMMQREWRSDCLEFLEQASEETSEETFNLVLPRSRCGNCGHQIAAWENIPIISYLFLRGKCSSCKSHISIQYPLVEFFTGIVSLWVALHFGVTLQTAFALLFSWTLIAASGIDIGHKLLPDTMILPLMWLGILLGFFDIFVDLETSVIGAMAGYMSLWSVYIVFKFITHKEGMGHGDFKLLALLGAWMGWKMLLVIVLTSSFVGAVVGLTMIALKKSSRATQIPFGPYLAAAGWISLLYGEQLNRYYFSFF